MHTTAFGAPVVPDVNSRKIWSDGFDLRGGQRRVGERRERVVVRRLVDDEHASVGGTEVETVEQCRGDGSR